MLTKFILASVLLSFMPGPDIIFVMTQSISRGFKAAFSVTLGLCSGLFFHTAAVALGVAALLAASPAMMNIIKLFGGGYLIWLGLSSILKYKPAQGESAIAALSGGYTFKQLYRQGLIMNLLNPKVILFFLSFLPGFVPQDIVLSKGWYIVFLGLCFIGAAFSVFTCVSVFGGYLNRFLHIGRYASSKLFAYISAVIYWIIAGLIVLG